MKKTAMYFVLVTLALLATFTARTQSYYTAKSVAVGVYDKDGKLQFQEKEKVNISIIIKDQAIIVNDAGSNFYVIQGDPIKRKGDTWSSIGFKARDKESKECGLVFYFDDTFMPRLNIGYKTYVIVYDIEKDKEKGNEIEQIKK